jgi:hypothetical protein
MSEKIGQIRLTEDQLEDGVATEGSRVPGHPIAVINSSPADLQSRLGIEFERTFDDLDYVDTALLELPSGRRFALTRHAHAPEPGTVIAAAQTDAADDLFLEEILNSLGIPRGDLSWVTPDIATGRRRAADAQRLAARRVHRRVDVRIIVQRAQAAGVPQPLATRLAAAVDDIRVPALFARAFKWSANQIVEGAPTNDPLSVAVQFKTRQTQLRKSTPLMQLALTVSEITQLARSEAPGEVPDLAATIRAAASDERGTVTLASLLEWSWRSRIPAIPLIGGGGFAAAAWHLDNAPTVVVKDPRDSPSFWLFDLAHELGHLALGHVTAVGIVDVDEPGNVTNDVQEREASAFALDLLLPEHVQLLALVRQHTHPDRPRPELRFKGAVDWVAREANVAPGLLGFVAAYALTDVAEPKDRWGSATNLDKASGSARRQAQDIARAEIDLSALPELDRILIQVTVLEEKP